MTSGMIPTRQPLLPASPFFAIVLLAVAASVGCGPGESPAQRVARLRAAYHVTLSGWVVEQPAPAAVPPTAAESNAESNVEPTADATVPSAKAEPVGEPGAAAIDDTAAAGLVEAPAPVSDVELALGVSVDEEPGLPGLTVEVALTDSAGAEKEHYRVWLDTSAVRPGVPVKLTYTLKEVPYAPGDLLTATLRPVVPKAERAVYKEYPAAP